jgi:hypothetical protein
MTSRLPILFVGLALASPALAPPALAAGDKHEANSRYDKGKRAFDDGDFAKALDELKASIAAQPSARAYLLLGNAYTKLGQLDDAKRAFESFLKAEPKSAKKHTVQTLIRELDVLGKTKIMVTTTPPGATVFLDLRAEGPRGKTPIEVPAVPGPHRVMLDLEGFESVVVNVTAVEGSSVPAQAALKAKGCEMTVEVSQPGASFAVDGQAPTPAPATVHVATGKHMLEVTGPGIASHSESVNCDKEKPFKVSVALDKKPRGVLAVKAPDGARVVVDGKDTPIEGARKMELDAG